MSFKIESTDSIENKFLNVMVYGFPGAGKTRFAGTAGKKFKPLILSAESGLLVLKQIKDVNGNPIKFDFVKVEKFEDIGFAQQFLRYKEHKYDTVIIDSLTEIQQVCMDKILRDEKREKAQIADWGTLNQRMVSMIRDFRDMPLNFIVTALCDSIEDQETGATRLGPLLQGKLKETVDGYFDEVFYLTGKEAKNPEGKAEIKRYLVTQGSNRFRAKDRSGMLPLMVEPDFCKIHDAIFAKSKTEAKETV